MIKLIIVDDEPLASDLVLEYLQDFKEIEVVAVCHNGFEGVKAINIFQPDLILLDIEMPKLNGFEMLEILDENYSVIFTTAFEEFAVNAFEKNALDYLLKPFSQERFAVAIEKFLKQKTLMVDKPSQEKRQVQVQEKKRIVVKTGAKVEIISLPDIIRLEADDDYVKIFSKQGRFLKKETLQNYEVSLDGSRFVRVHRSHLLNISYLKRIEPYESKTYLAILENGEKVPISRSGYQRLKSVLQL